MARLLRTWPTAALLSQTSRRHLRSAIRRQLLVPRHNLSTYGCRAFSVAGPAAWNCLSEKLHEPLLTANSSRLFAEHWCIQRITGIGHYALYKSTYLLTKNLGSGAPLIGEQGRHCRLVMLGHPAKSSSSSYYDCSLEIAGMTKCGLLIPDTLVRVRGLWYLENFSWTWHYCAKCGCSAEKLPGSKLPGSNRRVKILSLGNPIRLRGPFGSQLKSNTHRRRWRDSTVELSRVGGVYWIRN